MDVNDVAIFCVSFDITKVQTLFLVWQGTEYNINNVEINAVGTAMNKSQGLNLPRTVSSFASRQFQLHRTGVENNSKDLSAISACSKGKGIFFFKIFAPFRLIAFYSTYAVTLVCTNYY